MALGKIFFTAALAASGFSIQATNKIVAQIKTDVLLKGFNVLRSGESDAVTPAEDGP